MQPFIKTKNKLLLYFLRRISHNVILSYKQCSRESEPWQINTALTPYLHCLDCGPYWNLHCSSASCIWPGSSSEKWKSLCGGKSSRQSPAPELRGKIFKIRRRVYENISLRAQFSCEVCLRYQSWDLELNDMIFLFQWFIIDGMRYLYPR